MILMEGAAYPAASLGNPGMVILNGAGKSLKQRWDFSSSRLPLEEYAPFQRWLCHALPDSPAGANPCQTERRCVGALGMPPGHPTLRSAPLPIYTPLSNSSPYHANTADVHPEGGCSVGAGGINACACNPYVDVRPYGNLGSNTASEAAAGTRSMPSIHQPWRDSAQWHAVMK
ncbi:uncharacterized protein ACIBXB_014191 [Morphnus guianensis]